MAASTASSGGGRCGIRTLVADQFVDSGRATPPEHKALKRRVAGQTIGAVNARAGRLAAAEQTGDVGLSIEIRSDATHHIVLDRSYRNVILRDVDPVLQTRMIDGRKAVRQKIGGPVRDVQPNERRALVLDLPVDLTRNDIPRSQLGQRVAALHEAFALVVSQNTAFAANRLRDQEALMVAVFRGIQARGMKLNELHVLKPDAPALSAIAKPSAVATVGLVV